MAQPQQQRYPSLPPQQPAMSPYYNPNPPPRLPSPGGAVQYPPAKRPRLSPNPPSPYPQSPGVYSASPFLSPNQAHPPPFHAPQPVQPPHSENAMTPFSRPVMGPPARPDKEKEKQQKEKGTNVEDLSDVLALAGVDVRDEESALTQYNNLGSQSFLSDTATSGQSFGNYPHGQMPAGQGVFSQSAQTEQTVENEVFKRHKTAARALAENQAKELNAPFLEANAVRRRLQGKAWELGAKVDVGGLFDPIKTVNPQPTATALVNGEQSKGIVSVSQPSLLEENSSFAEMLSLLSLAANERIRGLVEDALRISRGRQVSAQGVVTPGFETIATGNGEPKPISAIPQNVTGTAWEDPPLSAISPMTVLPQKRPGDSLAPNNLPTPPTEPSSSPKRAPMPTISFPNRSASAIRTLASSELSHEKARLARRQKRLRAVAAAKDKADDTVPMEDVVKAPEVKMTKKERDRLQKQTQTEDAIQRQSNMTANMALGKSKYKWMQSAAGGGGGGGIGTGAGVGKLSAAAGSSRTGSGAGVGAPGAGAATQGPDKNLAARDRRFGDWREDEGRDARKIVIRDWIAVLERDGMDPKGMARTIGRLGQPFVAKPARPAVTTNIAPATSAVNTPVVGTPVVGTPGAGPQQAVQSPAVGPSAASTPTIGSAPGS